MPWAREGTGNFGLQGSGEEKTWGLTEACTRERTADEVSVFIGDAVEKLYDALVCFECTS